MSTLSRRADRSVLGTRAARAAAAVFAALTLASGCGGPSEISAVRHRHSPGREARIVVLPVSLPKELKLPPAEERTMASLCATELLRTYEILDLERFEKMLEEHALDLDDVLREGAGKIVADEMDVDAVLVSQIYSWKPGKPGILFLAKKGRVAYQARLVDLASGSLLWSANRVMETPALEPLPVAASRVFGILADDMPRGFSDS